MTYWAMKSEPETYSIDDLRKHSPAIWEGCRNYQVRNWMRDVMAPGDLALFCNSSSDPAGPVGVMRVVKQAYPDPTQFDPKSPYYDAKSPKDNPRWYAPDVAFIVKFDRVLPLAELRGVKGLEDMMLLKKGMRFSVMPTTKKEFEIVCRLAGLDPAKF
jgi:predicted RNA-binding protein with PUA-like domain